MDTNKDVGVVVNVIRRSGEVIEFLYLKRSGGNYKHQWWPVAGNRKENEGSIDCALRELREETGLDALELYDLGKEVGHIDGSSKISGYVAIVKEDDQVVLNYEHSDHRWLELSSALDFLPPFTHQYLLYINNNFKYKNEIKFKCLVSA